MQREQLDQVVVNAAVVHYIPTQRDDPTGTLLLTDAAVQLDDDLRSYFATKITERLQAKGLEVVRDEAEDECVAAATADVRGTPSELVAASKRIAFHLDAVQKKRPKANSSGLLAVLAASVNATPCLAIVKLEPERGVQFVISPASGQNVVDLTLLRNLTLTDKSKVYKTALLAGASTAIVAGFVADDQRGVIAGRKVGQFFLKDFLGCKAKLPAPETTYKFVEAVNATISTVESPERQGRYSVALLALLQSETPDITPAAFARDQLASEDRPAFEQQLKSAGIDSQSTFTKDTELIKVGKFKMTFKGGMVLVGTKQDLEDRVEMPDGHANGRPVLLKDDVASLINGQ